MGTASNRNAVKHAVRNRDSISTAILVLVLLESRSPQPMSTYQLGLWITDSRTPPRPLSVIIKTLASDGYICRAANAGKRAALWIITCRGEASLAARANKKRAALAWLDENPCYSADECAVLNSLFVHGSQSPKLLTQTCGRSISPIRTALKKLRIRDLALKPERAIEGYSLTELGKTVALDRRRQIERTSSPNAPEKVAAGARS